MDIKQVENQYTYILKEWCKFIDLLLESLSQTQIKIV